MPGDIDFGDIDDAQLEAAMAALLAGSSGSHSAASPAGAMAMATAGANGHGGAGDHGHGQVATDVVNPPPVESPSPLPADLEYQWESEPVIAPALNLDLGSGDDPGAVDAPDLELGPDLEVSPWSLAAVDDLATVELAAVSSGFDGPSDLTLGDLGGLDSEGFMSPLPPQEARSPRSSAPAPNFSRPWKKRRLSLPTRPATKSTKSTWSTRRKELVPALVVGALVILGLAAVVTAMTRDDGDGATVNVSTPTSTFATPSTIVLGTVPPPPGPLPVDSLPPGDTVAPAAGGGTGVGKGGAPAKAPATKPGSSPAPSQAPGAPAAQTPTPPPSNPGPVVTPTTQPPTTSPPTTQPPITSPPTTQAPRDHCAAFTDPVDRQRCLDAVGG